MYSATWNGTGAAAYIGLGSRSPDYVKILNLEIATTEKWIEWSRNMRSARMYGGMSTLIPDTAGNTEINWHTTNGIYSYDGGDIIASGNATYFIHLKDHPTIPWDKRQANVANGYDPINAWTWASTARGHWNAECNTTYVGVGSLITIKESATGIIKQAKVIALSSNGELTNEVTLDIDVASGTIQSLGPIYDIVLAPAGFCMTAGIYVPDTAVNVSGDMCEIQWGWFEP